MSPKRLIYSKVCLVGVIRSWGLYLCLYLCIFLLSFLLSCHEVSNFAPTHHSAMVFLLGASQPQTEIFDTMSQINLSLVKLCMSDIFPISRQLTHTVCKPSWSLYCAVTVRSKCEWPEFGEVSGVCPHFTLTAQLLKSCHKH